MQTLQDARKNWQAGVRIVMAVTVVVGLSVIGGAMGTMLLFAFLIVLPAEIAGMSVPAGYTAAAGVLGACTWGIAMLGRFRSDLIDYISGKTK